MNVRETFFAVDVVDMERATAFYVASLGARVTFASAGWTSLEIAGVRVALALAPAGGSGRGPRRTGLHFAVGDLEAVRAGVVRAGGAAAGEPVEVAPGVLVAEVVDTEGNALTLTCAAAPQGSA